MSFWIIQTLNGLSFSMMLFVMAAGLTLVFGLMKIINIAHGSFYVLGAYVGLTVIRATGSFLLAAVAAAAAAAATGVIMQTMFLRRFFTKELQQVLLTFGLFRFHHCGRLSLDLGRRSPVPSQARRVRRLHLVQGDRLSRVPPPRDRGGRPRGCCPLVLSGEDEVRRHRPCRRGRRGDAEGTGDKHPACLRRGLRLRCPPCRHRRDNRRTFRRRLPRHRHVHTPFGHGGGDHRGHGEPKGAFVGSLLVGLIDNFGKALFPELSLFTLFAPMAIILAIRPKGLFGKMEE